MPLLDLWPRRSSFVAACSCDVFVYLRLVHVLVPMMVLCTWGLYMCLYLWLFCCLHICMYLKPAGLWQWGCLWPDRLAASRRVGWEWEEKKKGQERRLYLTKGWEGWERRKKRKEWWWREKWEERWWEERWWEEEKEEKKEEGVWRGRCRLPQGYGSMVQQEVAEGLGAHWWVKKYEKRVFLPHVHVIQTTIDDIYVQVFFWEVFQLYIYIYLSLIAIMTRFLIVLVEPQFLPAYFFLELVLEICTFDIFVHVFVHESFVSLPEMYLRLVIWDVLEMYLRQVFLYLRCTCETCVSGVLEMYLRLAFWYVLELYLRFPNASAWNTCLENMQPDLFQ